VWREEAARRGLSLEAFHDYLTKHPAFDRELDERQVSLSELENIVVDSRLGFHFVKDSVKVFLTANLDVAATRLLAAGRAEEHFRDIQDAKKSIQERMKTEQNRYRILYGVDILNYSNYDIVVDTTTCTPQGVVEQIIARLPKK